MKKFDVIIIGAGAAGLLCASEALKRNKSVLILEKANKAGKKILISGGGRCNFTNLNINPNVYISKNPHFCKSALKRYTQWDIIKLLESYNLSWKEKKLGQLFCDQKSSAVRRPSVPLGVKIQLFICNPIVFNLCLCISVSALLDSSSISNILIKRSANRLGNNSKIIF